MYEPLDPETIANPFPVYDELRANQPILFHRGMNSWVLTRYSDCKTVLSHPDIWARDPRRVGEEVAPALLNVQAQDPPDGHALRTLLSTAVRMQNLAEIALSARGLLTEQLDALRVNEPFNWMRDVAAPVALFITSQLAGVPQPDGDQFSAISEAIARRMDSGLNPSAKQPGDDARGDLNSLVTTWLSELNQSQGLFLQARELSNDGLGEDLQKLYLRNSLGAVINASYSTLYAITGAIPALLLQAPEHLAQFADRDLMGTGLQELFRLEGPAQGSSRFATTNTVIGGHQFQRGDVVVTLFAAANRDASVFPEPNSIKLDRNPNPHLGFGWGPHVCIGAPLAAAWAQVLVEWLLVEGIQRVHLQGPPARRSTATLRCFDSLPMILS